MGKNEEKKILKRNRLLQTSFDLFTDKGFAKTTISDIVKGSGLAKGTFYLYFKDKYDLRDKLVAHKAGTLFADAHNYLLENPIENPDGKYSPLEYLELQTLAVVDYFIECFKSNHALLRFIAKNLSWGIFKNAFEFEVPEESKQFYDYYIENFKTVCESEQEAEMLLFTIIELVGSTCYSCILYNQPVSMEEYRPYLGKAIHKFLTI